MFILSTVNKAVVKTAATCRIPSDPFRPLFDPFRSHCVATWYRPQTLGLVSIKGNSRMDVFHSFLEDGGTSLWSVQGSVKDVIVASTKDKIDWTSVCFLREAISLSRLSVLLCLRLSRFAFLPGQTRVRGNDEVDDNSNTSGRHLNTKSSVCVRYCKVKLIPLACFHHSIERQMAQT